MLRKYKNAFIVLLPSLILLSVLQFIFINKSLHQMRGEELAEAVRSVFFWEHNKTFWGCTNIGYYSILMIIYNVFGFTLSTAKYFKLFMYVVSMVCLIWLLYKRIGTYRTALFLFVFGLSPVLLYFNRLATPYGLDLVFYPLCFLLLFNTDQQKLFKCMFYSFSLFFIIMIACTSYPSFLFYLPLYFVLYVWIIMKNRTLYTTSNIFFIVLSSLIGFILPLIFFYFYVSSPSELISDPLFNQGLFRGGSELFFSYPTFLGNLKVIYNDLFFIGQSYYYEAQLSEFMYLKYLFIILNIYFIYLAVIDKKYRLSIILVYICLLFSLIIVSNTAGFPSIRKATFITSYIYILLFLAMRSVLSRKLNFKNLESLFFYVILFLIIIQHGVLAYYNFPRDKAVHQYSSDKIILLDPYINKDWLDIVPDDPQRSMEHWISEIDKGSPLYLKGVCGYSVIYPIVAGHYLWNKGIKKSITVKNLYDESGGTFNLNDETFFKEYICPIEYLCWNYNE